MKINESPSIILAFHGMLGRKKQTSLLLLLLTLVFSFLMAAVIYSVSSAQVLQDTRCELYGAWQYLRLSDTAADAAQAQNTLPASAQVSTVIQNGIVLGADDGVAGGIGTVDDTFAQLGRIVPISGDFPTQPRIVFADEPTGNLDTRTGEDTMRLLMECAAEFGQTLIVVTHNPEIAQKAQQVIRIEDGGITGDV